LRIIVAVLTGSVPKMVDRSKEAYVWVSHCGDEAVRAAASSDGGAC
jgi:hypothetical protein